METDRTRNTIQPPSTPKRKIKKKRPHRNAESKEWELGPRYISSTRRKMFSTSTALTLCLLQNSVKQKKISGDLMLSHSSFSELYSLVYQRLRFRILSRPPCDPKIEGFFYHIPCYEILLDSRSWIGPSLSFSLSSLDPFFSSSYYTAFLSVLIYGVSGAVKELLSQLLFLDLGYTQTAGNIFAIFFPSLVIPPYWGRPCW